MPLGLRPRCAPVPTWGLTEQGEEGPGGGHALWPLSHADQPYPKTCRPERGVKALETVRGGQGSRRAGRRTKPFLKSKMA